MRINNNGSYDYCRWIENKMTGHGRNLRDQLPSQYFKLDMAPVRQAMLQGQRLQQCGPCYRMEQHHKISGRQKQLLKIGAQTSNLVKTLKCMDRRVSDIGRDGSHSPGLADRSR